MIRAHQKAITLRDEAQIVCCGDEGAHDGDGAWRLHEFPPALIIEKLHRIFGVAQSFRVVSRAVRARTVLSDTRLAQNAVNVIRVAIGGRAINKVRWYGFRANCSGIDWTGIGLIPQGFMGSSSAKGKLSGSESRWLARIVAPDFFIISLVVIRA